MVAFLLSLVSRSSMLFDQCNKLQSISFCLFVVVFIFEKCFYICLRAFAFFRRNASTHSLCMQIHKRSHYLFVSFLNSFHFKFIITPSFRFTFSFFVLLLLLLYSRNMLFQCSFRFSISRLNSSTQFETLRSLTRPHARRQTGNRTNHSSPDTSTDFGRPSTIRRGQQGHGQTIGRASAAHRRTT